MGGIFALCGGLFPVCVRLGMILLHAETFGIQAAEIVLRARMVLCGGLFKPLAGKSVVPLHPDAVGVQEADGILGRG